MQGFKPFHYNTQRNSTVSTRDCVVAIGDYLASFQMVEMKYKKLFSDFLNKISKQECGIPA